MTLSRVRWLDRMDRYAWTGPLLLPAFVAFVLIHGTWDDVIDAVPVLHPRPAGS